MAGLFCAVVGWGGAVWTTALGENTATARVDMQVSAGHRAELFVNDPSANPAIGVSLEPGVRRIYEFPGLREDLSAIRFDPTDVAGADVRIYGMELVGETGVLTHVAPAQLRGWTTYAVEPIGDASALAFRSLTDDPIMATATSIRLPFEQSPWRWALRDLLFDRLWLLGPLAAGLLVLSQPFDARQRPPLLLVAGAVGLASAAAPLSHALPDWGRSADVAVSRAAFLGESALPSQIVLAVALAVCLATAWWLARRGITGRTLSVPVEVLRRGGRRWLVAGWLVIALLLAPNIARDVSVMWQPVIAQWDADNINYWAYLTHHGWLPFRDFWYPYGAYYLFDLPWPAGPAIRWIYEVLLFGGLWTSLWALAGRRSLLGLILVLTMILAEWLGLVSSSRYLLAPSVALACAAVAVTTGWTSWMVALVPIALAAAFEPPQLIYAAPAVLGLAACEVFVPRHPGRARWSAAIRPVAILTVVGAGTFAALAGMAWGTGQLRGAWHFYSRLSDVASYSTFPTRIDDLGWNAARLQLVVLWWPLAVASVGLYERLLVDSPQRRLRGALLMALGLVMFMTLQKHLIRPMEVAFTGQLLLTSLIFIAFVPSPAGRRAAATAGLLVGLTVAGLTLTGRGALVARHLADVPARAIAALRLFTDPGHWGAVNDTRFAPARFASHHAERALVDDLGRRHPDGRPTLFALSDAPVAYILTGQAPMWQSNMYNTSPLDEQDRTVRWLRETPPDYVVLDRRRLIFDDVHVAVRVPLVAAAIIEAYVPDRASGSYDVFRRRQAGEPVNLDTWRRALGDAVAIGALPSAISLAGRERCAGDRDGCDEYLIVDVDESEADGRPIDVSFSAGTLPFTVSFITEPGRTEYVVPVGRLWFARAAAAAGVPVALTGGSGAAIEWSPVRLASGEPVLY